MKKTILTVIVALAAITMSAQTVNIHLNNGDVIKYESIEVDYIDFSDSSESSEDPHEEITPVTDYQRNYENAFVRHFGNPSAGQSWGFDGQADEVRVIVEDMDSWPDFDFNDVVFDVKWTDTGAIITLQAVGSLVPITVAGKEVHEMFGVSTDTFVNAIGEQTVSPVSFEIEGDFQRDANNIEVKVSRDGNWILLNSLKGCPPSKLAVSTNFKWCLERIRIAVYYPEFVNWVCGSSIVWY